VSTLELDRKISSRVLAAVDDYSDRVAVESEIAKQLMRCTKQQLAEYARLFVEIAVHSEIRVVTAEAERRAQEAHWCTPEGTQELADKQERDLIKRELKEDRDQRFDDESRQRMKELNDRHFAQMRAITDEFERELRIKWTSELLDSPFALGDGTSVKWGDATVAQHEARADALIKHAAGTAESAARHRKAITDLTQSGARNLRQMMSVGVAA
jgi:hypothetical protein